MIIVKLTIKDVNDYRNTDIIILKVNEQLTDKEILLGYMDKSHYEGYSQNISDLDEDIFRDSVEWCYYSYDVDRLENVLEIN